MKSLIIAGTNSTPDILLDPVQDKFEITGVSQPENVFIFYDPFINWLDKYIQSQNNSIWLKFVLTYFNPSS